MIFLLKTHSPYVCVDVLNRLLHFKIKEKKAFSPVFLTELTFQMQKVRNYISHLNTHPKHNPLNVYIFSELTSLVTNCFSHQLIRFAYKSVKLFKLVKDCSVITSNIYMVILYQSRHQFSNTIFNKMAQAFVSIVV